MSGSPDPGPPGQAKAFAEAVEALLMGYLPDDVRAELDGNLPAASSASAPYELNQLQARALHQAGVDGGQIEARILKVEVDQLRREIERLERVQQAQAESSISEGQVYAIVAVALGALIAMVGLLALFGNL
ncbi:MAG TPA: hypothetical protein VF255_03235 [Solirubrobacterales bacterium]